MMSQPEAAAATQKAVNTQSAHLSTCLQDLGSICEQHDLIQQELAKATSNHQEDKAQLAKLGEQLIAVEAEVSEINLVF
jgi:uncharacterized protein YfcZ (UPF0381/DUF406 family)